MIPTRGVLLCLAAILQGCAARSDVDVKVVPSELPSPFVLRHLGSVALSPKDERAKCSDVVVIGRTVYLSLRSYQVTRVVSLTLDVDPPKNSVVSEISVKGVIAVCVQDFEGRPRILYKSGSVGRVEEAPDLPSLDLAKRQGKLEIVNMTAEHSILFFNSATAPGPINPHINSPLFCAGRLKRDEVSEIGSLSIYPAEWRSLQLGKETFCLVYASGTGWTNDSAMHLLRITDSEALRDEQLYGCRSGSSCNSPRLAEYRGQPAAAFWTQARGLGIVLGSTALWLRDEDLLADFDLTEMDGQLVLIDRRVGKVVLITIDPASTVASLHFPDLEREGAPRFVRIDGRQFVLWIGGPQMEVDELVRR